MSRRRRRTSRRPALAVMLLIIAAGVGLALCRLHPGVRAKRPHTSFHPAFSRPGTEPGTEPSPPAHAVTARIYFSRIVNGKERLYPVRRELLAEDLQAAAQAAVEELVSGEVPTGCARPLPEGARLERIWVKEGRTIADFSPELVSNFAGGSEHEGVAVYAIVNTLTSLPSINQVHILVDGKEVDTIGGHLDTSGPLTADDELVVPSR